MQSNMQALQIYSVSLNSFGPHSFLGLALPDSIGSTCYTGDIEEL